MRHAPRPLTAVLVFLVYLVVFYGLWIINGIEYENIGENSTTVLKWHVAPLVAGAILLVIAVSVLGWWRPAMSEVKKSALAGF